MKKIFRQTAAMLIALLAVVSGASHAENIADDPFIRQNLDRANFEPGGQYHLFNSRGKVAERSGSISVIPFQDFRFGDFRIQQAGIRGDIGYTVRFSGHGHEVHSPFDNHARRQANDERGNVNIGLSLYQIDWSGHEHHPADGYDGPQGGGYPAPKGARDEYSYHIEGQAQTTFYAPTDTRSTMERLKDRYANMPQNFANRSVEANKKIFDHNDRLNRWGNGAETVNGLFAAVANGFQSVGEVVGVGDAIDGIYRGGAIATMHGIDQLPSTKAKMDAIGALGTGAGYIDSVSQWAADNPNATETVKAGANIGTAAWSMAKGVKAGVSGDFGDAAAGRAKQRQMSNIDGEMAGGNRPPKPTRLEREIETLHRIGNNQRNSDFHNRNYGTINPNYTNVLSDDSAKHILHGDKTGGGHMYPGQTGKTTFPQHWSDSKILHEVSDIATSPNTTWYAQTGNGEKYTKTGKPARWVSYEVRDGIRIRTVYEPATGKVITAFPDNTSKAPYKKIK